MKGRKAWILQEHLSRCPRCREYLENLERVSRMAREDRGHSVVLGEETLFSHPSMTVHR